MRKPAVLALILAVLSGPVAADEASHRQSATELLRAFDFEQTMMTGVNASIDMQIRQNPTLAPYRSVFQDWARSFVNWESVGPPMVDLYVANFTEQELRDMAAFYRTPTGQKALSKLGPIMTESTQIGMRLAEEHQQELRDMIRKRALEIEQSVQQQDGGAPSP